MSFRGNAGSASCEGGQWARSESQRAFCEHHHFGFSCQCPYGDVPFRDGMIATHQECRAICCNYHLSDEYQKRNAPSSDD